MRVFESRLNKLTIALLVLGLVGASGCAGARRPTESYAKAELAIEHAEQSEAGLLAPAELSLAREKFESARRAMNDRDYELAHRLADEARVHAQLAEAKAESETARRNAEETRRNIEALAREAERNTEVVITKSRRSTVVIEKPNHEVVIERSSGPDVVIERKPAPDVVIEHRSDAPDVVISPRTY